MKINEEKIIWKNPYFQNEEVLPFNNFIDPKTGKSRIPVSFSSEIFLIDLALNGLASSYNLGSSQAKTTLVYVLVDFFDEPEVYISRKVNSVPLRYSIKNIGQYINQISTDDPYSSLADEIGLLLTGDLNKSSEPFVFPSLLEDEIIHTFRSTFGNEMITGGNRQIQFRRKLNEIFKRYNISVEARAALRLQSATYYAIFYENIARSFKTAIRKKMSVERAVIYGLLHSSHSPPKKFQGALLRIPPIASLPQFSDLRSVYKKYFETDPLSEIAVILRFRTGRRQQFLDFVRKVAGLIRWYRIDYLLAARQNDGTENRRATRPVYKNENPKPTPGTLAAIAPQYSANPKNKLQIESILPESSDILERRKMEQRSSKLSSIVSEYKDRASFEEARRSRLSEKQQEALDSYLNGDSYDTIARNLGISRDSARDRIDAAIKKLKK